MSIQQTISALLHNLLDGKAVPVLSGPLQGWQWLPQSGNHAYWLGRHEKDYVDAFADAIKPGDTVLDIGAQAGYFTLVASRRVGEKGKAIAFEPFPQNTAFIKAHCKLNNCNNVTLLEAAVGGSKSTRTFQSASVFMGHLSDSPASEEETESEDDLTVDVVTLDDLIEDNQFLVPNVMKIDTEGMEYWVLQGGKKLIQENRPVLFIATHGKKNQGRTLQLLKDWGYEIEMVGNGTARNADYIAKPTSEALQGRADFAASKRGGALV